MFGLQAALCRCLPRTAAVSRAYSFVRRAAKELFLCSECAHIGPDTLAEPPKATAPTTCFPLHPCRLHLLKASLERGMQAGRLSIPEGLPFLLNVNDASWCPVAVRSPACC